MQARKCSSTEITDPPPHGLARGSRARSAGPSTHAKRCANLKANERNCNLRPDQLVLRLAVLDLRAC
eukprot:65582-Rhodomonas_salina.2